MTVAADPRLHLQHGPIDLIISADGSGDSVARAHAAAAGRFKGLLEELVEELPYLRTRLRPGPIQEPRGSVAARMVAAVAPHRSRDQVTPMAAVAGAVADEILAVMTKAANLDRCSVNNGGDISLWLATGHTYRAGLVIDPRRPEITSTLLVEQAMGIGGIATSGRHGRSFSLGIADSVTVVAPSAAAADAAATLIANRVDVGDQPAVLRAPARSLDPDTDLGDRLVTVLVAPLSTDVAARALSRGLAHAELLVAEGIIGGAVLHLAGASASAWSPSLGELETEL